MKIRKAISFFTAAVMAVSALPILSVSAEESTYALGDVDMDGYITGHDAAVVSRYILKKDITLTEEQLALADVNEDGNVNQADADWIYENEICSIGDIYQDGTQSLMAAYIAMHVYAKESVDLSVSIIDKPYADISEVTGYSINYSDDDTEPYELLENGEVVRLVDPVKDEALYREINRILLYRTQELTQVEYNSLDADADGKISSDDAYYLICMYVERSVALDVTELYFGDGKYYVDMDSIGKSVQDE